MSEDLPRPPAAAPAQSVSPGSRRGRRPRSLGGALVPGALLSMVVIGAAAADDVKLTGLAFEEIKVFATSRLEQRIATLPGDEIDGGIRILDHDPENGAIKIPVETTEGNTGWVTTSFVDTSKPLAKIDPAPSVDTKPGAGQGAGE